MVLRWEFSSSAYGAAGCYAPQMKIAADSAVAFAAENVLGFESADAAIESLDGLAGSADRWLAGSGVYATVCGWLPDAVVV